MNADALFVQTNPDWNSVSGSYAARRPMAIAHPKKEKDRV